MSRTLLCVGTALLLVAGSIGVMVGRWHVLGDEVRTPRGPGTWRVLMVVNGESTARDAKMATLTPLDYGQQHILREVCRSNELSDKPPTARHPDRREVLWSQRAGVPPGLFRAHYDFYCTMNVHRPTSSMSKLTQTLYAAPPAGEQLQSEPRIETDHQEITALARRLTAGLEEPGDQVSALFHYVDREIANEASLGGVGMSAVECLKNRSGDAAAKSRLLVALCRNRGIPARLVVGLTLAKGKDHEQVAHVWSEAWARDHWKPMCAFHHHDGHVPSNYLVFGFGDQPIVRGRGVRNLDYAFLVEHTAPEEGAAVDPQPLRRALKQLSLDSLPPAEQRLVEFLLLLPVAALMVCIYRNVIGLVSFGTFAPALVGLAFREMHSIPGILVFVAMVLLGWGMRRALETYHLLQVPRTAFMLSLMVAVLILAVVGANYREAPLEATKYIPLFPMVILTGMIERFWTLEVEDGAAASFRSLLGTMLISASIALFLSWPLVVNYMFLFPEALGIIMALQLLIGRYTGYRLTELFRFREVVL